MSCGPPARTHPARGFKPFVSTVSIVKDPPDSRRPDSPVQLVFFPMLNKSRPRFATTLVILRSSVRALFDFFNATSPAWVGIRLQVFDPKSGGASCLSMYYTKEQFRLSVQLDSRGQGFPTHACRQ